MPFSTDFVHRVGPPPSRVRRYLLATGILVLTTLVRLGLDPLVHSQVPLVPYVASAVLVTWFCGAEAGLVSVVIAAFLGNFIFESPRYEFLPHPDDMVAMLVFGTIASGLVLLVASWKRTELTLRQRAEELQTLLDTVPAAVFVTRDRNAERMEGNRFAAEYARLPTGSNLSLTAPPPERPTTFRVMKDGRELSGDELPVQQVMARGTEVRENEFDIVCEDGTVRTLFGNATPLRDDKGNVRGSIGAFVDVTERRRMEARLRDQAQELERANRIKDDFLATLGHELRTPLNAIVGWSSMLLRGGLGEDVVRRAHESIARNAEAQRTLIEDVLDVSRIVSGNLRLDLRQVDVAAPVRAALDCVRQLADEKAVVIRAEFDDRPAPTVGDSARLQQVFLNLLSNAVKFTRSGGHIRVALDRSGPDVRVRVQDDGVGIPGELLPHVFERFRQADSSSRRKNTGLGLGLAIVRQLTELHGGRVMAESAGEGQGATFTVLLPLRPFHERRHVSAPPPRWETSITPVPAATPSLCGARVLVVDDHKDARDLASSVLQESGASVHVAASARQALDEVGAADPDVLVIDISMPDVDGYDLLRAIRNGTSRAAHAPAIAFTAYAREEDRRRALATGFQRHLAKPVEADALVRAVASVWQGGESPGSA